jgi:hypothetical protein
MKRHRQLFEQVCSFENLLAAACKAWRGKRSRPPAAAFYARFEDEVVSLRSELLGGTYVQGLPVFATHSSHRRFRGKNREAFVLPVSNRSS